MNPLARLEPLRAGGSVTTLRAMALAAIMGLIALGASGRQALAPQPVSAPQAASATDLPVIAGLTAAPLPPLAEGEAARLRNRELPILRDALEDAPAFKGLSKDLAAASQAQACLAAAMYYEAGFEGAAGRLAVGQVVLNRVRHPAFPHEVCAVVTQRSRGNTCQFTFFCDGAMARPPVPVIWRQTLAEAAALLAGKIHAPVGMATHYHADYVLPYWAPRLDKIAVIGSHIFYRWPGQWGRRSAFTAQYAGREAEIAQINQLAGLPEGPIGPDAAAMSAAAPVRLNEQEGGYVDPSFGWVPKISQGASESAGDPAITTD